jgi:hypothetical protein
LKKIPETAEGALFGINPERRYYSKANLLSACPMANLQKNAPKRSEFSGAGTNFALSLGTHRHLLSSRKGDFFLKPVSLAAY